jgi:predicted nuclease of predicted toxin-antitoxin system
MKLLFDQNLSWRLPNQVKNLYPESQHTRNVALSHADDLEIWDYAKHNGFVIVSKDHDFQQRSLLFGHPPKVILLRVGNCVAGDILELLKSYSKSIHAFEIDDDKSFLAIP